jgi:ferredoxin
MKVVHLKKDCISCGACAAIASDYWEMDADAMAQLKDSTKVGDKWELEIDSQEAKQENQEASDVCPVNIIHIEED